MQLPPTGGMVGPFMVARRPAAWPSGDGRKRDRPVRRLAMGSVRLSVVPLALVRLGGMRYHG